MKPLSIFLKAPQSKKNENFLTEMNFPDITLAKEHP